MHRHTPLTVPFFSFRRIFGFLAIGLLCFLLTLKIPAANAAEVVDRIVAVVNDEIIVLQEVNTLLQALEQQLETAGYSEEEKRRILENARQSYINDQVNQKLIVQAAKEVEWLEVTEQEIDASIESYKQENNLTDEQLLESLEKQGLSMEDLRTHYKEEILASSLLNYEVYSKIVITKADVTQYYNEHPEKYQGKTTYNLLNIFIKAPASDTAAAKEAVENKLAQIFGELEAGESFQSVARKYSEFKNAGDGGKLGSFQLKDLLQSFSTAIEPLSAGEYTRAIETSDGYQIFFVQEINKEGDVSLESVYSEIEDELYKQERSEKLQAFIEGLRENAHIKILE